MTDDQRAKLMPYERVKGFLTTHAADFPPLVGTALRMTLPMIIWRESRTRHSASEELRLTFRSRTRALTSRYCLFALLTLLSSPTWAQTPTSRFQPSHCLAALISSAQMECIREKGERNLLDTLEPALLYYIMMKPHEAVLGVNP